MTTTELDMTAGSPRLVSASPPPDMELSFAAWIQITSYENYIDVFGFERNAVDWCFVEADAAGTLVFLIDTGFGTRTRTMWADSRATWNYIAGSVDDVGLLARLYVMTAAGVWTALTPLAIDVGFPLVDMALGAGLQFTSDGNGTVRYRSPRVWSGVKSESQLRAEAFSAKPRDMTNLVYWNSGLDASTFGVDQSGHIATMTTTGTPTDAASDPGVPWQR